MAGKSSNLWESSSTSSKKQEEKRKQCATMCEKAKKQRRTRQFNATARPGGPSVPVMPLLNEGSNAATAFPMAGVNGAAKLWSTAATLVASGRASALAAAVEMRRLPTHFAVAPAPAPSLQPLGAAASYATAPLVVAQAADRLVPLQLHFVGSYSYPIGRVVSGLPEPAVGMPLAAALDKMDNSSLGRMLSALMPACHPPLLHHQSKTGAPPPWWPKGTEDWWVPEVVAHLDTVAVHTPVPFASSYSLKKVQKVAVLVAIVKHLVPDFARITTTVMHSGKLSVPEISLWHSGLNNERAKYMRPVFVALQPPQQQQQGDGSTASNPSSGSTVAIVHSGNDDTASDSCDQAVVNHLPAAAGASVSAPADDGVVSAADALAYDGREQPAVSFPGDDGTHKQGATATATVAAHAGHFNQASADKPEMQPAEQHSGVQGNGVAAAEGEQVHPVGVREWYFDKSNELSRMFVKFESFEDAWYNQ